MSDKEFSKKLHEFLEENHFVLEHQYVNLTIKPTDNEGFDVYNDDDFLKEFKSIEKAVNFVGNYLGGMENYLFLL